MSTFLYFAGFILLILILKFIYDSYLTDNTEREWQRYKEDFPEKGKKIEGKSNKMSYINKVERIKKSISKDLQCELNQVEEKYIEAIQADGTLMLPATVFNNLFKDEIKLESQNQGIKEDETRAYLLYSWAKKVFIPSEREDFDDYKYHDKERNFFNFFNQNFSSHIEFFQKYPSIYDSFVYSYDECIRQGFGVGDLILAVLRGYLMDDEIDHQEEVRDQLIKLGLEWADSLYSRSNFVALDVDNKLEKIKLGENKFMMEINGLDESVNGAIDLLDENSLDDLRVIILLYKQKSRLLELMNDENGALDARIKYSDYRKKLDELLRGRSR